MCGQCLSTAEATIAGLGLVVHIVKDPLQQQLAEWGLAPAVELVGRDAYTVAFLRSLELDPVEILGADVVAAADNWVKPPPFYAGWRWRLPIESQRRLAVQ